MTLDEWLAYEPEPSYEYYEVLCDEAYGDMDLDMYSIHEDMDRWEVIKIPWSMPTLISDTLLENFVPACKHEVVSYTPADKDVYDDAYWQTDLEEAGNELIKMQDRLEFEAAHERLF